VDLSQPDPRLSRTHRWLIAALFLAFVAFGGMVELRSAFLSRRMGDLGVYLRAAWAVRAGADLYGITDDNGWHYNYPPLFAILMAPLADPPRGVPFDGGTPFAVSVVVFYALSLVLLFAGIHYLASALESRSAFPSVRSGERFGARWWQLRLLPLLVCLPPIGHTLMRGQANILLLALVCGFEAELLRQRNHRAGWFLAGAICLKIFPAYLLLYPIWRRDFRCLAGCAAGLLVGLVAVPVAVMGPERTAACYQSLADSLLLPALGRGGNHSRDDEIIWATRNDSQSFECVIHKTMHLDPLKRPDAVDPVARRAHRVLAVILTFATLAAARWRRVDAGSAACLFVGVLSLLMVALNPVCHTHYFSMALPLVMGLLAAERERRGTAAPGRLLLAALALSTAGNALPLMSSLEVLKDTGLALYSEMLVWGLGCVALWKACGRTNAAVSQLPPQPVAA
jgi:hypothetical protein